MTKGFRYPAKLYQTNKSIGLVIPKVLADELGLKPKRICYVQGVATENKKTGYHKIVITIPAWDK